MEALLSKLDFGNEAGDDVTVEELIPYFVQLAEFSDFTDTKSKMLVATSRKGVGKSALLKWAAHTAQEKNPEALVISCRGADLVRSKFHLDHELKSPSEHIDDWMIRISALINRKLANTISPGFNDDQFSLIETAELEGYKSRNIFGCFIDRLGDYIQKYLPEKIEIKNEVETLKRVKDRQVWILIDDLDATFQNTEQELMEISTFFSACRYMVQDFKDIYIRASMRSEVWTTIRRYDESLDKMEQYVSEIHWSLKCFRDLLYKRIKIQIEKNQTETSQVSTQSVDAKAKDEVIAQVFAPQMLWGADHRGETKTVPPYQILYTVSYERPRWAIQLCKLAQKSAIKSRQKIITKSNIDEVWGDYGNARIADLVAEHKHQCENIEELITSFRGCVRLLTKDELFNWIQNHVTNHMDLNIEDKLTRKPREIAHFLYRVGFILARSDDDKGGYEHYQYSQMPDFLTGRQDFDFGVRWEIHPCYREALDIEKINKGHKARFGELRHRF